MWIPSPTEIGGEASGVSLYGHIYVQVRKGLMGRRVFALEEREQAVFPGRWVQAEF